jgi:hypothetical protein
MPGSTVLRPVMVCDPLTADGAMVRIPHNI